LILEGNARVEQPRLTAVGKKNWIFIGPAECGQRSAILFTRIEACRERGGHLRTAVE
jgi:transposase